MQSGQDTNANENCLKENVKNNLLNIYKKMTYRKGISGLQPRLLDGRLLPARTPRM
jgi:hypothetical protein